MRTASLIAAGIIHGTLFSQGQFATVSVTPPTDGCNGVWAVQATSVYCTPSAPYTFEMEPSGCVQLTGWGQQMGDFLIPLCALPCSLTVTTADGVTCSGSTSDAPIGINENALADLTIRNEGGTIELVSTSELPRLVVSVLDVNGRLVSSTTFNGGQRWRIQAPSAPGPYVLSVEAKGFSTIERFGVTE